MPPPGAPIAPSGKKKFDLSAWVQTHKGEAIGIGAGGAVGAFWLYKKAKGTTAAAAATTTTAAKGVASPGANEYGNLENQINELGDRLNSDTDKDKTKPAPPSEHKILSSDSVPGNLQGLRNNPVVEAVSAPGGGMWDLLKDGTVFAEGGAKPWGSYPDLHKGPDVFVSLIPEPDGGFAEIDNKGQVYVFPDRPGGS
jgi:hypothetical protein